MPIDLTHEDVNRKKDGFLEVGTCAVDHYHYIAQNVVVVALEYIYSRSYQKREKGRSLFFYSVLLQTKKKC